MSGDERDDFNKVMAMIGKPWVEEYGPPFFSETPHERSLRTKPDCEIIGQNGNIYNLMGIAYRTLRENSMEEQAKKMFERVTNCNNYYKALAIIGEYVNITGPAEPEESMTMGGMT